VKKALLVFLGLILLGLISNVQGQPIMPYKENDYSIDEVKRFSLSNTTFSSNWNKELVKIVNDGLLSAGENLVLSENNTFWILDHVYYERRNLTNFYNSKKDGIEIKFFPDKERGKEIEDGIMVGIFKYNKCSRVLFKTRCMNLLKVPIDAMITQVDPIIITSPPEEVREITKPVRENWSGGKSVVVVTINNNVQPAPIPSVTIKKKSWFRRNLGWIIPTTVGLLGFVVHDSNHYWYLWFPKEAVITGTGTMPNGRGDTNGTGTQNGGRSSIPSQK